MISATFDKDVNHVLSDLAGGCLQREYRFECLSNKDAQYIFKIFGEEMRLREYTGMRVAREVNVFSVSFTKGRKA